MAEQSETGTRPPVKIFGRYAIRDFLHRSDIPFEWVHLENAEDARAKASVHRSHDSRLPHAVAFRV
jgi:thioredoxin reductase (NADPH)